MNYKLSKSTFARALLIGCLALSATACLHDDDKDEVIIEEPTNTAPSITSTGVLGAEEGTAYSYTVTASDAEGDTLTMTAPTLPMWLSFDATTGVLTGTPEASDEGDHPVVINVSDGTLSASQSFTITVTAIPVVNTPPSIDSTAVVTGTVDVEYSYTLMASDVDGDSLDLSSVTLPTWGVFDTSTGILSGTPLEAGNYDVELMVSDGLDAVSQTFTIVISEAAPTAPTVELVIFENMALAEWALWDCCAGSTPSVETDDVDHDQVAEFDVLGSADTVQGFTARDADGAVGGTPFDASAFSSNGTLSFEMKIVTAPADGTPWILKLESAGAATNTGDLNLNTSNELAEPVAGVWQTYTFNLSALAAAGLDLSAIDVVMVFPAWGQGAGAVYRVDNVMVLNAAGSPDPDPEPSTVALSVFENMALAEWALWDCCAGSTPSVETDDLDHDQVAEFDVLGSADTVQGFTARDADGAVGGTPFDASAFSSNGTLSFEMKIVTAPADGTPWILKLESAGAATNTGDLNLNTSNELAEPVAGVWQTYTFNLSALAAAGLDLSAIDVIMVFPAWGQGAGAVYRVDNVNINTGGAPPIVVGNEPSGDAAITFETGEAGAAYTWTVFENDDNPALEIVANPDASGANTSAMVAKFTARQAGMPWAGVESAHGDFGPFTLDATNSTIKIMVYKTVVSDVGIKFAIANGGAQPEIKVANTLVNQWEELTFDFSNNIGLVESIDIDQIIIFADFNLDGRGADTVSYFDNITFSN